MCRFNTVTIGEGETIYVTLILVAASTYPVLLS